MSKIQKNYQIPIDDFLRGDYDDSFRLINAYNDTNSEFTPYKASHLGQADLYKIAYSNALIPSIISNWQSNVGQNDSSVILEINDKFTPETKKRKDLIKKSIYKKIYSEKNWKKLELQIIALIAIEGNAVLTYNSSGDLIVESIYKYNVYYDSINKTCRYAYLVNNVEHKDLKNLKHGVELYHLKDPVFENLPIAPSRIDTVYGFLMLEQKAVRLNTHLFANGFFSNILLQMDQEVVNNLSQKTDQKGKNYWSKLMDSVNDKFRGINRTARVGFIAGLKGVIEIGKNNKDAQFYEMIKELTPERLAWAYSMTIADFGSGRNTTYNNVNSFNDALYDKVGRPLEKLLDKARNEFVLKNDGIITTESFYIQYNEPKNPDKIKELESSRKDYEVGAITLNEYREKLQLAPLVNGDELKKKSDLGFTSQKSNKIDSTTVQQHDSMTAQAEEPKKSLYEKLLSNPNITLNSDNPNLNSFFSNKIKKGFKKTLSEEASTTEYYQKFKARFEKAIKKQLTKFCVDLKKLNENTNLIDFKPKLEKLETYYNFKTLEKDLLYFANIGLNNFKEDIRINFNKKNFDSGNYPLEVLNAIENRTAFLLKGNENFGGLDVEMTKQVSSFIAQNAGLGVYELADKLVNEINQISLIRAELIVSTEVTEAIESTREMLYQSEFIGGFKEWQTATFDVCPICIGNENDGVIDIKRSHKSGVSRPSGHPRCRCTELYYSSLDEI